MAGGEGQQIAVFVVLAQAIGAGGIGLVPVHPGAVQPPVKIAEGNLPVLGDGLLNGIHIIVDGFVHAFDPPGDVHIPLHQLCILGAAQGAELFNQRPGLFLG